MTRLAAAAALALLAAVAGSGRGHAAPVARPDPAIARAAAAVSEAELSATLATLVGFGTRHTMSDRTSPTRGIGAASRWAEARLKAIGAACGGCLDVRVVGETVTGRRLPQPTLVQAILAVQRGHADPDRVVVISGHIDSRASDPMDATSDAPGANDDGSGTAAVIEAARVLSKLKLRATVVYAVLEGEEQGLHGGRIAAAYAKAQGWRVEADLNNDIVGNSQGQGGERVTDRVRVFSEGTRTLETPEEGRARRYNGGEVDSPSRNLARYVAGVADRYTPGLRVMTVYRTDRFSRGGDQTEFLNQGFPAVRLSEGAENYDRQHQNVRVEGARRYGDTLDGVDVAYLAKVTRLNIAAAASLALAPAPPSGVAIDGAVSADTAVRWAAVPGASRYRVWWRRTDAPRWEESRETAATSLTLPGIVIDDWFFGVSAVGADGHESPVVFPGPAGDFGIGPRPATAAAAP